MTFEVAVVGTMGEGEERREKEHYNSAKVYPTALQEQAGRKPICLERGGQLKKTKQKKKPLSEGVLAEQFDFYTAH